MCFWVQPLLTMMGVARVVLIMGLLLHLISIILVYLLVVMAIDRLSTAPLSHLRVTALMPPTLTSVLVLLFLTNPALLGQVKSRGPPGQVKEGGLLHMLMNLETTTQIVLVQE